MTFEEQAKIFKAFCDDKRLRILDLLRRGEQCTCVLTEKLALPQSTLSYHMKILCDSGIVSGREDGKWTYYHIDEANAAQAVEMLKQITKQAEGYTKKAICCN